MLKPSVGRAVISSSTPLLFVDPLKTFILESVLLDPSALNSAVCAKLLFSICYKVTLVLNNPLQKSFLIPNSYWSIIEGLITLRSTVVPVFGVNEFE